VAFRQSGTRWATAYCQCFAAILYGPAARGTALIAAADNYPLTATSLAPDERHDRAAGLAVARAVLGVAAFQQAWSHGQAMAPEAVVELAPAGEDWDYSVPPPTCTRRELERRAAHRAQIRRPVAYSEANAL
jgi:hypothetical protein